MTQIVQEHGSRNLERSQFVFPFLIFAIYLLGSQAFKRNFECGKSMSCVVIRNVIVLRQCVAYKIIPIKPLTATLPLTVGPMLAITLFIISPSKSPNSSKRQIQTTRSRLCEQSNPALRAKKSCTLRKRNFAM